LPQTPQWPKPCITPQWTTPRVQDVHAQMEGNPMSKTTERILIAIALIVAVVFATRDGRAGIFVKCDSMLVQQGLTHTSND
jgi:hypothetical protein